MATKVNVNNILLTSVAYTDLEAKQSYVDLATQTSFVDVGFSASYIDVGISADVTMPDVLSVEIISPSDVVKKHTGKNIYDISEGFVDNQTKLLNKFIFENVLLADNVTVTKIYFRTFLDSVSTPDAVTYDVAKSGTADLTNLGDLAALGLNKAFSDGFSIIDEMDGELDFFIFKVTTDNFTSSDAKTVDFQPVKADNVTSSSSGILAIQDYCDITYFLEDYVGISRAFT